MSDLSACALSPASPSGTAVLEAVAFAVTLIAATVAAVVPLDRRQAIALLAVLVVAVNGAWAVDIVRSRDGDALRVATANCLKATQDQAAALAVREDRAARAVGDAASALRKLDRSTQRNLDAAHAALSEAHTLQRDTADAARQTAASAQAASHAANVMLSLSKRCQSRGTGNCGPLKK